MNDPAAIFAVNVAVAGVAAMFALFGGVILWQIKGHRKQAEDAVREAQARVAAIERELSEYKLRVAERYMTADAFVLAASEIKREIKDLRALILRNFSKGDEHVGA